VTSGDAGRHRASADSSTLRRNVFGDTVALLSLRIDPRLALRPELLGKLVLEDRHRELAAAFPQAQSSPTPGAR